MRSKMTRLGTGIGLALVALFPAIGATQGSYTLVPNWPKLPAGVYFGSPGQLPTSPNTRRDAPPTPPSPPAAAAAKGDPYEGNGASAVAIDAQDRIYVFNRGKKPVMVFDRDGNLLRAGADQEINGRKIASADLHGGGVDAEGNVYVVDRGNARVVKLSPNLDTFLLQIGTTGVEGTDATHFNRPSGLVVLRNGNIVVTDGYVNNRVVMFDKDGKFVKQASKGGGSPKEMGSGKGEFFLPHKLAIGADENLFVVDRQNYRIQVLDKDLNYIRELSNPSWNPWDIAIALSGGGAGVGFVADHTSEQVLKISLTDGRILARWGKPGRQPGEFDWVHGVVVDSRGAVYVVDTYGQHLQKFVPAGGATAGR